MIGGSVDPLSACAAGAVNSESHAAACGGLTWEIHRSRALATDRQGKIPERGKSGAGEGNRTLVCSLGKQLTLTFLPVRYFSSLLLKICRVIPIRPAVLWKILLRGLLIRGIIYLTNIGES